MRGATMTYDELEYLRDYDDEEAHRKIKEWMETG